MGKPKAPCEGMTLEAALSCLANQAMGAADLREAAQIASAHRGEIPGATTQITSHATTVDGQSVELTFHDPKLVAIPAGSRTVVIFDPGILAR